MLHARQENGPTEWTNRELCLGLHIPRDVFVYGFHWPDNPITGTCALDHTQLSNWSR